MRWALERADMVARVRFKSNLIELRAYAESPEQAKAMVRTAGRWTVEKHEKIMGEVFAGARALYLERFAKEPLTEELIFKRTTVAFEEMEEIKSVRSLDGCPLLFSPSFSVSFLGWCSSFIGAYGAERGCMTDRLTSLSWIVVLLVAASALIPDMGFHSPVGTDDVLPLLATLIGSVILLLRPLPDPGPMVITLVLFGCSINLRQHLCAGALALAGVGTEDLPESPCIWYFVLAYSAVVEGLDARKVLVACGVCAVIEAVFGLGAFLLNYRGPWYVGVYFTKGANAESCGLWLGSYCWNL